MTDIPSVPPSSPSAGSASSSGLSNAPVQQAPPDLTAPPQPVQVSGTVISSNPQARQLSIQTPQGPIVVQTAAALPQDTPVMLEIFTSNAKTRATISVIRQSAGQAQTLAQQATAEGLQTLESAISSPAAQSAATPMQEGSTMTALQLPAAASEPAAAPAQPAAAETTMPSAETGAASLLQIGEIAAALRTAKETGFGNIQSSLPAAVMDTLREATDIKSFLGALPPQQLQDIAAAFSPTAQPPAENAPALPQEPLSAPPPQGKETTAAATPAPENAVPESAAPDMLDNNLLHIMRARLLARTTQASLQQPPAPKSGQRENFLPLSTTLELLANAFDAERSSDIPAFMRSFMPQDVKSHLPLPQNMFRMHILKILPPKTTPAQIETALRKISALHAKADTAAPGKIQVANVETATSSGQPILQTEEGHFIITTPVSVPVGSKIILTATPMTAKDIFQHIRQDVSTAAENTDAPEKTSWPALLQALQTLTSAGAQTAALAQAATTQILHNTLPTPTQRLVPTALFFLAALRSGDIKNWLGENTLHLIEKMAEKGTADALSGGFGKMSAQSKTALPGGWHSISIPLRHEEQISQMQFYVRKQNDREHKNDGIAAKPATRFILNMTFSRLGPLQLDGYIQKKSFDMILRTEDNLPLDMRQALMQRFAVGLAQVQMQGGITFQTRNQGWMVPEVAHIKTEA